MPHFTSQFPSLTTVSSFLNIYKITKCLENDQVAEKRLILKNDINSWSEHLFVPGLVLAVRIDDENMIKNCSCMRGSQGEGTQDVF